ncbi:MAG: 3-phosphoshikimate 1-carboxyvinyltransferase [Psychroflexus halocasei]
MIKLSLDHLAVQADIQITGSKSESNRFLVLKHLFKNLKLHNLSNSDDTQHLENALKRFDDSLETIEIDVEHAGTAMRFLTALCAVTDSQTFVLKGSQRMHNRPISVLVDALRTLGADISYLDKEGFPPLKINGLTLKQDKVSISGAVSSQYISALMLIAPQLENGLDIQIEGQLTSKPYVEMTLQILNKIGVQYEKSGNKINIYPLKEIKTQTFHIESDWSSASYFFSFVAISDDLKIKLSNYRQKSLQGDAQLIKLYQKFGVGIKQIGGKQLVLYKKNNVYPDFIKFNLIETPDLAQTIAVTCLALGIDCELSGLKTLKIKETDRLIALKNELEKFGAKVEINLSQLKMKTPSVLNSDVEVYTYQDHRMAMAFAPLSLLIPIKIKDENVVSKSYPNFWNDLRKLGISIKS